MTKEGQRRDRVAYTHASARHPDSRSTVARCIVDRHTPLKVALRRQAASFVMTEARCRRTAPFRPSGAHLGRISCAPSATGNQEPRDSGPDAGARGALNPTQFTTTELLTYYLSGSSPRSVARPDEPHR